MIPVDIIILALIAGFIALRLRSTLGQDNGQGKPSQPLRTAVQEARPDKVVHVSEATARQLRAEKDASDALEKACMPEDVAAAQAIADIKAVDANFRVADFLDGAKAAFDMVFDAFTKGDKQALKMLLAAHVLQDFEHAIDTRTQSDTTTVTTLVSIVSQQVIAAQYNKPKARIQVRFVSEQISVMRDKQGAIVEGDPSHIVKVQDEWIFERDLTSRNPNWQIIDT